MDDYINESEFSFSESYSITPLTINENNASSNINLEIEENTKDYPIRCLNCWNIPRLNADFKAKKFITICDNHHKNIFMSFDDLYQNSNRKLSSLLCHQCKKASDKMYRCNDNNFFFCENCKNSQKSNNFCELNDIDITCPKHNNKFKYYDKDDRRHLCDECFKENSENYEIDENYIDIENYVNYKETIDKYNKKAIENIKMWNNTMRIVNDWVKKINDKINDFLNSIKNYCLLQQKIVNFLNCKNSYLKYNNNYNIYYNYNAINNKKIDNFIRKINEYLNYKYNKNSDIGSISKFLIDILNEYDNKEMITETDNNMESKDKLAKKNPNIKNDVKLVNEMQKKIIELSSEIKTLKLFDKEKYFILGLKSGEITINEQKESNLDEKIKIKEFDFPINQICEIDKNLIIASDEKNHCKIIQIKEDFSEYSIIKRLDFLEEDKIYKIISLPILSYYKNRHYFAISRNKSISVYKSNKMPINSDPPALGYHNQLEEFSIVQPSFTENNEELNFFMENNIQLNNPAINIRELNEKYMAVAIPNGKVLMILNTQKDFKEEIKLNNIISNNYCPMKITKERKELIIGNKLGFSIVEINDLKKIKNIKIKHNVLFLDSLGKNTLCLLIKKSEDFIIRQYEFKNEFTDINKTSELNVLNENDIVDFFIYKNKLYYIDNSNKIYYFE